MDKLKYVKIENEDGSLSDNIPLGVDAENVDVTSAGGSQNLADYISVNDGKINSINSQIDDLQDNNTSLSNQIKSLSSGSPKGSYATVSALKSANPETGVYVIQENGHLYSWTKNANDAIDLGVYQATEIGEGTINESNLENTLKSLINEIPNNSDFREDVSERALSENRFNENTFMYKKFIRYQDGTEYIYDDWGSSDYIEVEPSSRYIATVYSATNSWKRALWYFSRVVLYDNNKNYINGYESFNFSVQEDKALDIPSNVKYIRFSFNQSGGITEEYLKGLKIMVFKVNTNVSTDEKKEYEEFSNKYSIKYEGISKNAIDSIKNYVIENIDIPIPVINESNLEKFKKKYRYLVSTFFGSYRAGLILLGTNDLKTFDLLSKQGIYTPQNNVTDTINLSLRDPAIIKIGDYFYYTYTIIAFNKGSNKIGFCRTKDFNTFEELDNLNFQDNSVETYDYVWAPDWFRDGEDIYVLGSCHNSNGFSTSIAKYNPDTHILENATTLLSGTDNGIDFHMYIENGNYYLVGAGGLIYKSNLITGTFTKIETNLTTGYEADFLVKLDNGKWRLYRQQLSTAFDSAHMTYIDSLENSLESNWGDVKLVKYTRDALNYVHSLSDNNDKVEYYHWTIYDLKEGNDNNNNFVN